MRLPHGRGDVSSTFEVPPEKEESSPRAWGCFPVGADARAVGGVFPTGVGMFLGKVLELALGYGLPHGRGDVSEPARVRCNGYRSSPRAWGCFRADSPAAGRVVVFPTGVGMFL